MTTEQDLLYEILTIFKTVFKDSAYFQYIKYQAEENKVENWYFKAKQLISKH